MHHFCEARAGAGSLRWSIPFPVEPDTSPFHHRGRSLETSLCAPIGGDGAELRIAQTLQELLTVWAEMAGI